MRERSSTRKVPASGTPPARRASQEYPPHDAARPPATPRNPDQRREHSPRSRFVGQPRRVRSVAPFEPIDLVKTGYRTRSPVPCAAEPAVGVLTSHSSGEMRRGGQTRRAGDATRPINAVTDARGSRPARDEDVGERLFTTPSKQTVDGNCIGISACGGRSSGAERWSPFVYAGLVAAGSAGVCLLVSVGVARR